jgi:hypothetical protein
MQIKNSLYSSSGSIYPNVSCSPVQAGHYVVCQSTVYSAHTVRAFVAIVNENTDTKCTEYTNLK